MARMHRTLALITVLGTTPLLCATLANAASETPRLAVSSAPARLNHMLQSSSPLDVLRRVEPNAPATPIPMNLPDNATAEEVQGEYALGIASLIVGTLLIAGLMLGAFYIVARQTWSTQH